MSSHPHRYDIPHPPHVHTPNDRRLPPLKSLNFPPAAHEQPPFDLPQDAHPPSTANGPPAFAYPTPTPTSATSAPAYVHRQPLAFQAQTHQHHHDHDTWQQQPHGTSSPSQMHAQLPPNHSSSFARSTPLVPTTVDPPPARAPASFPAPPPKHRPTYPPPSPYTPNASHPYAPAYPPASASAPYTPYNASPGYAANTTSPTFGPSTSPPYASASANAPHSYPSQNAYPTPTSAYPHPPPSPTPTPTQPHAPSPSHYVTPAASTSAYAFDDTRPSTAYETQPQPARGHSQVQDARDSRVPIPDRARHPHTQSKLVDARLDSRHDMYAHAPAQASVPEPAAVDPRHSHAYSHHEPRPAYSHQADSSRPGTSYAQPQTQSELARPYPPESRTQDTKYTYVPSHAPEPSARAGAGYAQDPPGRMGYPPEGPTRHPHAHDSRAGYAHGQETQAPARGAGAPYVPETRQSSGYVSSAQDARHGYPSSEASASYVPAEQRHGPSQFVPNNADQRSPFGDSRSAGTYHGNGEPPRSGYTASDSVSAPAVVALPRPPQLSSQHHLPRQNGQPHGYASSLSPYPPQHAVPSYNGSPASAPSTVPPHSQSQSYISPSQPAPHPSHLSQPSHGHPAAQSVHPTQTQQMHPPEQPRPAYVSPADTMHARGRFPVAAIAEQEREREQRDRERAREREEREREKEREREREKRERESQRERDKERERLAALREKERERDREREGVMHEVLKHCTVLYNFAARYAHLQSSSPLAQPPAEELSEMTHRAQEVVRLLESLRSPSSGKLANASIVSSSLASASTPHSSIAPPAFGDRTNSHPALNASGSSSGAPIDLDTRAPKRPWEETQTSSTLPHVSQLHLLNSLAGAGQAGGQTAAERSAAEKDMEIIRTKRALTTSLAAAAAAAGGTGSVAGAVGGAVGAGKSKYRKRSRATPPGKCHSCNIRETPEWRRGPDGARTLCNACGLHYAKLVRKRDKALATEGGSATVMRIDMETLRASTRAAESEKAARAAAAANGANPSGSSASGSNGSAEMDKMSVHTSSFQIMPVSMHVDGESAQGLSKPQTQSQSQQAPPQPQPHAAQPSTTQLPPPASASGTPHLHPHGIGSGQGHPLPLPHGQGNAHYSHSSASTRAHGGPPPPPWAGKAYGQEMQHSQQSFIRTSHSVSSGASPPR